MGDVNPICTLGDYSKPSHEGYMNTIKLLEGNNMEGPQNSTMISLCSNNIKENLSQKHGLVSRTYSKKSLIIESTFGSKSTSFMTMSLPPQDEPITNLPVVSFVTEMLKNSGHYERTSPSMTMKVEMTQGILLSRSRQSLCLKMSQCPHDAQYCMENPKQAFVDYASSRTDETRIEYKDHEMTVESKEEFEEETEEEIKEEEEDSLEHFDTFPNMKELRLHYNWIMGKRLGRKPSKKICNFVGRVKGLKVFVGNFTYKCDFMVLEDTTRVIDHDLGSFVLGKPFIEATRLFYDRKEGTITFEKDKEKIVFKMPHKMEMFKYIDFTDIKTDRIPPFVIESDDDNSEKTHYSDSLDLEPEYKYDENVYTVIRSLIATKAKRNKREVT
nr:MAK10-like protein [Tanacetum cinerariifolium]